MAEDSIFDSGLGGILDESLGSRNSSEWENNLLGSLSDSEMADLMSEPTDSVGTVRMASGEVSASSDAKRAGVDGRNVIDDIAELASSFDADAATEDMSKFVTASLYEGNSPKQIVEMLRVMHPAGHVDAFLKTNAGEMMSKYGKLGFLYIDAADFQDDDQMDEMLGGQKKIGQMALETIKPAGRCADCTLNKSGFCMRYNLRLDEKPSVDGARQARRILNKFAQRTLAGDQEMLEVQSAVDAMERRSAPPEEYEKAVSAFLTKAGRPGGHAAAKGDTGRARLSGEYDDSVRPTPSSDPAVEDFVRVKLAKKGDATFAEMRGSAMASVGARRAKAWFRSNRSLVTRLMEAAARGESIDCSKDHDEQEMDHIRRAMVARYGQERAERIILATGGDPSKYTELLSRAANTETRRIDTGKQMPREMPQGGQGVLMGRLDDELRAAATAAASRGVPEGGIRESLSTSFGNTRLAAFEDNCPGEITGMVQRAATGFGAADNDGFRSFEESLEKSEGDVNAAIAILRKKLGRARTRRLIAGHPGVEAAVLASSRTHGQAADTAADRRVGGTASVARSLRPDTPLDFEALTSQVLDAAEPDLLASAMPRSAADPTLVASPEMEEVGLDYAEGHADISDPIL